MDCKAGNQQKKKKEKRKKKKNVPARVSWHEGHGDAVRMAESKSVGKEGGEGVW